MMRLVPPFAHDNSLRDPNTKVFTVAARSPAQPGVELNYALSRAPRTWPIRGWQILLPSTRNRASLVHNFQSKLDDPRIARHVDYAEAGLIDKTIGRHPLRVVCDVEEFRAELRLNTFCDGCILEETEVQVLNHRPRDRGPPCRAEADWVLNLEAIGLEEPVHCALAGWQIRVTHQIRPGVVGAAAE